MKTIFKKYFLSLVCFYSFTYCVLTYCSCDDKPSAAHTFALKSKPCEENTLFVSGWGVNALYAKKNNEYYKNN